jgi:spore coat polysaccharide biosynthesis predicted glycosyltransferase SpsG
MTTRRHPSVLFVAAAGRGIGFGHLVRCGVLAETLGVAREMVLRGRAEALAAAMRFGWTVHRGRNLASVIAPDLIVVDDPSPRRRQQWITAARRAHLPVAAVVDGDPQGTDGADLVVDGSVMAPHASRLRRCSGPSFAVLSPRVEARRAKSVVRNASRVIVTLGGGAHVRRLGVRIATAIRMASPEVRVDVVAGFTAGPVESLPEGCRWIHAPGGLVEDLATAGIAVVGGGVTLYEACALRTPIVALPVVSAQRRAIAAFASAGAVLAVDPPSAERVADAVARLLRDERRAAARAARAARLVDGGGAKRVADRLRTLVRIHSGDSRHAA